MPLEWEINKKSSKDGAVTPLSFGVNWKAGVIWKTESSITWGTGKWKKWEDNLISPVQSYMNDSKFIAEDT